MGGSLLGAKADIFKDSARRIEKAAKRSKKRYLTAQYRYLQRFGMPHDHGTRALSQNCLLGMTELVFQRSLQGDLRQSADHLRLLSVSIKDHGKTAIGVRGSFLEWEAVILAIYSLLPVYVTC